MPPGFSDEEAASWKVALTAVEPLRSLGYDEQLRELESIRLRCWLNALQCKARQQRIGTAYFLPVEEC